MSQQEFLQQLYSQNTNVQSPFADKVFAHEFIDQLFGLLFTPRAGRQYRFTEFEKEFQSIKSHLSTLVYDVEPDRDKVQAITDQFFQAIPLLYKQLQKDAEAILENDPAATSINEVWVAYPGFYAIAVYRLAHQLWEQGVPLIPRLFTEYAHSKTGIDIHPAAQIGESFFIDHGTGIVIGETTVIGNNVKIYQGVTLGALNVAKAKARSKRHPSVEDNVTIYSGTTILGGQTVIGHDSIIGGNVWLTHSVDSFSVVYHKSEVRVRDNSPFPEALNFVI